MTTEQRTGFRLPWSSDRSAATAASGEATPAGEAKPADAAPEEPSDLEAPVASVAARPAAGAGLRADDVEAADEGSWVTAGTRWAVERDAPADALDEAATQPEASMEPEASIEPEAAWPEADMAAANGNGRGSHGARPAPTAGPEKEAPDDAAARPISPTPTNGIGSRPTRFLAEMSRAMQAAAQAARDESLARLGAEAKQKIDQIQEQGTSGTTELRRRADDDVAATREWSKAEIARIREETERRIADRKTQLEADVERHAASIKRRAERVREGVARHETELAAFIDRLMAEDDPARIAMLAQELPEPPVLDELDNAELATIADAATEPRADGPRSGGGHRERGPKTAVTIEDIAPGDDSEVLDEPTIVDAAAEHDPTVADAAAAGGVADDAEEEPAEVKPARSEPKLSAAGAAAAEAEALAGLDDDGDPAAVRMDRSAVPAGGVGRTELLVTGLASVAGIAGFKRELSRLPGVRSVGVSAGESGQFVFAVSHDTGTDMATGIGTIAAFEAQLTGRRTGSLLVTATEPAAAD